MDDADNPSVLVVEDNAIDAETIRRGFHRSPSAPEVLIVGDGDDAIDYLLRQGAYRRARRPDLVLLDLALPGTSGIEVLELIKTTPELAPIPVVVLSSSRRHADILGSYKARANVYMTKPFDAAEMARAIAKLERFFLRTADLPTRAPRDPGQRFPSDV